MSKILYEVYKNDIKDSESVMYGKWYARLKSTETMSLTKMAKHISEHGSVFTDDVVEGVMKKFKNCLLEMLLNSRKVKITGLGTFYLTAECQKGGADKEEDFYVREHLKALHIRFLPDQTAEDNISSREFIKKAEFVNVKSLLSSSDDEEEGGGNTGGNTSGGNSSSGTPSYNNTVLINGVSYSVSGDLGTITGPITSIKITGSHMNNISVVYNSNNVEDHVNPTSNGSVATWTGNIAAPNTVSVHRGTNANGSSIEMWFKFTVGSGIVPTPSGNDQPGQN